ncbi:acyltransferase family protein [Deminuibacter soli]|uniref:Acyltransferase n=1 Tax=Deminuibacter soli TaxID=2291815 RepID=A0A3E1NIU0_9BACT|nr:acyltransferase [Deminuibacter soli]RFM27853.1 acyltransferase [Deminuibacter soli]
MLAEESKSRIGVLDGFRCIAVIMVMLVHYTFSYTIPQHEMNLYPYGDRYSGVLLFRMGYTGVQFFFIISGFVIFMTLERCRSIGEFLVKRFIRLFPALLFCSIVTFLFVQWIDPARQVPEFHNTWADFFPSLTFSDLWFWNRVFGHKVEYIDIVYWTLTFEIKFYILASLVFFFKKENFFRNWMGWTLVVLLIHYAFKLVAAVKPLPHMDLVKNTIDIYLFPEYIILFTLGIYFYMLFTGRKMHQGYTWLMAALVVVQMTMLKYQNERIFVAIYIALFIVFLYRPQWLRFLSTPFFAFIGLVSYPLYLLHARIGVMLLHKLGQVSQPGDYAGWYIVLVMGISVVLAYLVHRFVEKPSADYLRRLLLPKKSKPAPPAVPQPQGI